MDREALQALAGILVTAFGALAIVGAAVRKMTAALDTVPTLATDTAEAIRAAREAHTRADEHNDRLIRLETRWETHNQEHLRAEAALDKRLERIEEKLDRALEGRG